MPAPMRRRPLSAAVRIDVGQPLPADTDAVAPLDAVTIRDGVAQALAPVGPGEGVLPAGGDVAARRNAAAGGPPPRPACRSRCWGPRASPACAFACRACVCCAPGRNATP